MWAKRALGGLDVRRQPEQPDCPAHFMECKRDIGSISCEFSFLSWIRCIVNDESQNILANPGGGEKQLDSTPETRNGGCTSKQIIFLQLLLRCVLRMNAAMVHSSTLCKIKILSLHVISCHSAFFSLPVYRVHCCGLRSFGTKTKSNSWLGFLHCRYHLGTCDECLGNHSIIMETHHLLIPM